MPPRIPARIFLPIRSLLKISALYAATGKRDSQRDIVRGAMFQPGADSRFRVTQQKVAWNHQKRPIIRTAELL